MSKDILIIKLKNTDKKACFKVTSRQTQQNPLPIYALDEVLSDQFSTVFIDKVKLITIIKILKKKGYLDSNLT